MSEQQYRQMLLMLMEYDEYIFPENKAMQHILEKNIKRHLCEYKEDILLDEYNEKADRVYRLKKEYEKAKRKKQPAAKDYEIEALRFFREVFTDKNLHNTSANPKKVTLYEKCINIVNCLPPEQYNRSAKFKLKGNLNYGLLKTAILLGEEYLPIVNKARQEMQQYQTAIEKAKHYAKNPSSKYKQSIEEYNRRQFEEWYYR